MNKYTEGKIFLKLHQHNYIKESKRLLKFKRGFNFFLSNKSWWKCRCGGRFLYFVYVYKYKCCNCSNYFERINWGRDTLSLCNKCGGEKSIDTHIIIEIAVAMSILVIAGFSIMYILKMILK